MTGKRNLLKTALVLSACGYLSACSTAAPGHDQRMAQIDKVMAQAAEQARTQGQTEQSLSMLEQLYKRTSSAENALKYAHALREEGYYNRASLVIAPFATDENVKNSNIVIEHALILAAMGDYIRAEEAARKAVLMAPESGQAYHVLGIALDAQGHHEQAQIAFEKGLDNWEGDPSQILNNIGLNLAALGFLDESIETLRKALDTAPNRREIERNLRIVTALQYQPPREGIRMIPKPSRKPESYKKTEAVEPVPIVEKAEVEVEAASVEEVEAISLEE